MANYTCKIRTNYFHVKDEEAFRALMARVYGEEAPIRVFEDTDEQGRPVFGFGCHGGIAGVKNAHCDEDDDVDDSAYDEFIDELKKLITEDDAIIIMESGHENLRYVQGLAHVITHDEERWLDIRKLAVQAAKDMLQNPDYTTKCDY